MVSIQTPHLHPTRNTSHKVKPRHISVELDISDPIKMLSDKERIEWVSALLETISEEGTIDAIRGIVNNPLWDDQKPIETEPTTE